MKSDRFGLYRRRYWVLFFTLVSLIAMATGFLFYRAEVTRIQQEKYLGLKTIAELKAGQISQWRQERLADANKNLANPFFKAAVESFCQRPFSARLTAQLKKMLQVELAHGMYTDVVLLTIDGRTLLSASAHPDARTTPDFLAMKESITSGKAVLGRPYRSHSGKIYVDAMGPVISGNGKPVAVFVLRSDLETFLYPMIQSWPTPSRSAETLLVCREGDDALFLNNLRHKPETALTLRYSLTKTDAPAVQAVLGKQGIYRGKDYREAEVLADLRPVQGSPWFIVAKQDTAEILAEARWRAGFISLAVLLFILLAASMTAYTYRDHQADLYKKLYRTEQKERESYQLFRTTLYSIGDAVITTGSLGRVKQMNLVAEQLTGWQEAEAQGKALDEVFHIINEETRSKAENPVDRVLLEGKVIGLANHTVLIARDGSEYPIADSGAPIHDGNGAIIGVVLVFRDQTKERNAGRELQESEEKYRQFFMASRDCVFITSPFGQWTDFNDAALELFGYESREDFSKVPISQLYEHPDERAQFHLFIAEKGYVREHPVRLKRQDGTVIDALITVTGLRNEDGSIKIFIGTIRDITAWKTAEKALRESEEKYRRLFDDAVLGVFQSTPDGKIIVVNKAYAQMFGYSSPEEILASVPDVAADLYANPARRPPIVEMIKEGGKSVQIENVYKRKDGSTFIGMLHAWSVLDSEGELRLEGFVEDITERKRAEKMLLESERMSRATIDALPANLCVLDEEGTILDVNRAWRQFADENPPIPPNYAIGMNYFHVCDNAAGPNSAEAASFAAGMRGVIRGDIDEFRLEYPCHSSEEERWFIGRVTRFPGDGALRLLTTHVDITDRKKAELTLRENKARLDLALQAARMGAWLWDIIENKRYFDDQVCHLLGIDPVTFTGSAEEFFYAVHPDDRDMVKTALTLTIEQDVPYELVYRAVWPDGSIHYIAARGRLLRDEVGRPMRLNGIIWDITSRKLAEEALEASLKEKEILLKEIHHRVKNNLQIISSLLNLQSRYEEDEKVRNIFRESIDRVRTMASVHAMLYQSTDYSRINLRKFIDDLTSRLSMSYRVNEESISISSTVADVFLDINTAIPCGLIINELVSNAMKHAFPSGRKGEIRIAMRSDNDDIILTIMDNGAGFPEHIDFKNTDSLGLQLVMGLVEQLDGAIEMSRNMGTEFKIIFSEGK